MRRILLAFSALSLSTGAYAADRVIPEGSGHDWSGFYVGVGTGAGAVVHDVDLAGLLGFDGIGGEGVFGEVSVGYDRLVGPRFLVGAFLDGRLGNIGTRLEIPGGAIDAEARYGFDAGVRLGYLVTPSTLAYVLGGYSWQRFELASSPAGLDFDWDADGYVLGAGIETALTGNLTLKTEYRYAAYGAEDFGTGGLLALKSSMHTMRAGLNYRFGFDSGAPASFETPAYDWTGFYVGGAVGAGGLAHDVDLGGGLLGFNGIGAEGVSGEVSVGYDHEFAGGWVAGVSIGGRYSSIATKLSAPGFALSVDADYGFDVLGRLGMKLGDATLAYVVGGYSWQHFDIDISTPPVGSVYDWGAHGYSVGAGVEAALSERTAVNVEYRYSAYEGEDFGAPGFIDLKPSSHTVRAGLKFKLF